MNRKGIQLWMGLAILASCGVAGMLHAMQEDAFISFRYAQNLLAGHGIVYNSMEMPLEGYTNFLWVLLAALASAIFGTIPIPMAILGVICWGLTLWIVGKILLRYLNEKWALAGLVLIGSNYFVLEQVATGMETPLVMLWMVAGFRQTLIILESRTFMPNKLLIWSWLGAFAFLTRPDTALAFIIMGIFLARFILRNKIWKQAAVWMAIAPVILLLAGYMAWKFQYFGDLLPHTFYVKTGNGNLIQGALYMGAFILMTGYFLFEIPIFLNRKVFIKRITLPEKLALAVGIPWLIYIWLIGGDYMGFRMVLPVLPIMLISGVIRIKRMPLPAGLKTSLIAGVIGIAVLNGGLFGTWIPSGFIQTRTERIAELEGPGGLKSIAHTIGEFLPVSPELKLATAAAGYIPYHLNYTVLDMSGLNTTGFLETPPLIETGIIPGHSHFPRYSFLAQNNTHLVVGRWLESSSNWDTTRFSPSYDKFVLTLPGYSGEVAPAEKPGLFWLECFTDQNTAEKYGVVVIYLKRHPLIEQFLESPSEVARAHVKFKELWE